MCTYGAGYTFPRPTDEEGDEAYGKEKALLLLLTVLAMLVVVGGTALAVTYTTSKRVSLKLNKPNYVGTALTKLASNAVGAAFTLETDSTDSNATPLSLQTSSQAPMQVDSDTKVANLNADELDGIDSMGFIQGKGNIYHGRRSDSLDTNGLILNVPGFGQLYGECFSNPTNLYHLYWTNTSGQKQEAWWFNKDGVGNDSIANGSAQITPDTMADYVVVLQVGKGAPPRSRRPGTLRATAATTRLRRLLRSTRLNARWKTERFSGQEAGSGLSSVSGPGPLPCSDFLGKAGLSNRS